jgi:hypothetical protein
MRMFLRVPSAVLGSFFLLGSPGLAAQGPVHRAANLKSVEPAGNISPAQAAACPLLTYTIRFQNTGPNAVANIRIVDTLDALLDPSTFQLQSSSHPCAYILQGEGQVEFLFNMVDLPDSLSDEPGSHGFVKFIIRARPGLVSGDEIRNTAYIQFDGAAAVATNTVVTTVSPLTATPEPAPPGWLRLYPNPASTSVWVEAEGAGRVRIFDPVGRLVLESRPSSSRHRLEFRLPAGIYRLLWQDAGGREAVKKLVIVPE